jgi:Fe2+ or Zn2+ uptake regulation protein
MSHDEIAFMKLLQARGLRVTAQRLAVLDAVCAGGGHTTFGEIWQRVRENDATIDTSTVYRTLDLLVELRLISQNDDPAQGVIYEIVGQTPHHHLVCIHCGCEYAVPHTTLQTALQDIEAKYNFAITAQHLVLRGLCGECRENVVKP